MATTQKKSTAARGKASPKPKPAAEPAISDEPAVLAMPEEMGSAADVFGIIEDLEVQLQSAYSMRDALEQDLGKANEELTDLRETAEDQKRRIRYLEDKIPDLDMLRASCGIESRFLNWKCN